MKYDPTDWKDTPSRDTPINAERLNKIESALVEQNTTIQMLPLESSLVGTVSISKSGNVCHIMGEMMSPITMGGVTTVLLMPDGFSPRLSFSCPVFALSGYTPIGRLYFDAPNQSLKFVTSLQSEEECYFDSTYITS